MKFKPLRLSEWADWWRPRGAGPWIYGHRGARHGAPENTLAAFDLAREEGADGIEFDVRLDGDGEVVVVHDPTLTRVTDGRDSRRVDQLSRSDLADVDVGAGERIPTLEQVLQFGRQRGLRMNVELKADLDELAPGQIPKPVQRRYVQLVKRTAQLVSNFPGAEQLVLFSSFNPLLVTALHRLAPRVPAAWLVHEGQARTLRAVMRAPLRRALGLIAVHPQAALVDASRIAAWQSSGTLVNVWTVNEGQAARRLAELGVDGLITDCPGALRAALGKP